MRRRVKRKRPEARRAEGAAIERDVRIRPMRITGEWLTQAIRAPGSPGYRDLLENCSEEDYQAILQGDAWIEGDNIEGMRLVRRTKE